MMAVPEAVEHRLQHVNDWNFGLFQFSKACHGSPLKFMGYHLWTSTGAATSTRSRRACWRPCW